ncbi:dihydrofolate reductase family protein [Tenggerimyces flavus]|uniref:Dihydrofolate reductase family protein n=1 Tax=Tenggerimyces flavus TaxID=1708749 RepID=A0ABV7Y9I5_9ACTN|nr:dihydrofolate reductase family protein [Tenggerimyces flavus]MBM7788834.1 dihydrofolate reductase [Tenggerimyces flavus]
MTLVTAEMSISLDGYFAGPRSDETDWTKSPEALGFFRITRWVVNAQSWRERMGYAGGEQSVNSDLAAELTARNGAYVMGRRMADGGEGPWGEEPPFHGPVFVVTHRERETRHCQGGTSFTYVTDGLESAIAQAREAANGKNVLISGGGTTVQQAIAAGQVDELVLHIAPVLLGEGQRLLDNLGVSTGHGRELTPERVVHTQDVTHLVYRVGKAASLFLDDRGSGDGEA